MSAPAWDVCFMLALSRFSEYRDPSEPVATLWTGRDNYLILSVAL